MDQEGINEQREAHIDNLKQRHEDVVFRYFRVIAPYVFYLLPHKKAHKGTTIFAYMQIFLVFA